jgi:hypothetical protein
VSLISSILYPIITVVKHTTVRAGGDRMSLQVIAGSPAAPAVDRWSCYPS